MKKRSINLFGHATSVSMEPLFWEQLKHCATQKSMTIQKLVEHIDENRTTNLSSAIRVYLMEWLLHRLEK